MLKYILKLLLLVLILNPDNSYSQNKREAKQIIGHVAVVVSVENAKEASELQATQYILSNYDMKKFNVRAMSFSETKLKDMSSVSIIPFQVYEFDIKNLSNGEYAFSIKERYVLICYGYPGFINENGVIYDKVIWELIDKELWFKRMEGYVKSSSNTSLNVADALENGYIVNGGVTEKGSNNLNSNKLTIEFYVLDGDSYIVSDYSDKFKYVYNEKSLGLLNKETGVLSQINKKTILEISKFLKKPVSTIVE